jgi:hypothetical protein
MNNLPNYKMLGIGKTMNEEFDSLPKTDLQKLIKSSYFQAPLIINRRDSSEFCNIEVIGCEAENWWYKDLTGFEFFCEIKYRTYNGRKTVVGFKGVKLSGKKMIIFRDFSPKDVIMI